MKPKCQQLTNTYINKFLVGLSSIDDKRDNEGNDSGDDNTEFNIK